MNLEGMDVDQVDSLARHIDTHARTLESIAAVLGGLAAELSHLWRGPAAATFQHDCETRHRPAITAAASAVSEMHHHLIANLAEQRRASAAGGAGGLSAIGLGSGGGGAGPGGGGGGGGGWTADRAWKDLENATKIYGAVTLPFGIMELAGKSGPLFDVLDKVGYVGTAVGAVGTVDDAWKASNELDGGHYAAAANDFADGVADGLKAVPGPLAPVTYLAGVDLTLLHKVANLDWKDTPNPLSWSNFKQYYAPEFGQMVTPGFWGQAAKVYWSAM